MPEERLMLGLESSCDDTAAAVLLRSGGNSKVLSSVVVGQDELHASFGGVVPEIAARAHAEMIDVAAEAALAEADLGLSELGAIAVTAGPGLIGGVMSGVQFAKGLAAGAGIPLVGVNHLAGHALTPRMTHSVAFPYLALLVSGGHCQFLIVDGPDDFLRLGSTIDDAPGEAFDKVARSLALPQPGGPAIEQQAHAGNPDRFSLPRPLLKEPGCDLSFSGLKTAVLRARDSVMIGSDLRAQDRADICASFQRAVSDVLSAKTSRAIAAAQEKRPDLSTFAVVGGVAANTEIREALRSVCDAKQIHFVAPEIKFCTDNAAMIAHTGAELIEAGARLEQPIVARPRWPLDRQNSGILGSGQKGPKA